MLKRPHYIAFSLVLFLALLVLNLPGRTATQVERALGSLFLPLFGLAASVDALTEHTANSLIPRNVLLDQLRTLRQENDQLRIQALQSAEIWRENERLRQAANWQQQSPWKLRPARVVLRDPANWWRTVQIDAGRRDGVVLDMPVLTPEGLVGRVTEVGYRTARVALVGDPECRVSATVEDGALRDYGVILSASSGALVGSVVDFTYVNQPKALKAGRRVLTSGLSGAFPPGILIGHIVDTNRAGFGLYAEARVKLGADLDRLEEVWVILQ